MAEGFDTTNWSLVLKARDRDNPEWRESLARLCETYWPPLYAYVRRCGRDVEEARDLTQSYFVRLLDKDLLQNVRPRAGRFRAFLLTTLKHTMADEHERATAAKRGGGRVLSLDLELAERQYRESDSESTPDRLFERR